MSAFLWACVYWLVAGCILTTVLCAVMTVIRNRPRVLPRLHEIEDRNQFYHDWPGQQP